VVDSSKELCVVQMSLYYRHKVVMEISSTEDEAKDEGSMRKIWRRLLEIRMRGARRQLGSLLLSCGLEGRIGLSTPAEYTSNIYIAELTEKIEVITKSVSNE
jgi:hypothetical protein